MLCLIWTLCFTSVQTLRILCSYKYGDLVRKWNCFSWATRIQLTRNTIRPLYSRLTFLSQRAYISRQTCSWICHNAQKQRTTFFADFLDMCQLCRRKYQTQRVFRKIYLFLIYIFQKNQSPNLPEIDLLLRNFDVSNPIQIKPTHKYSPRVGLTNQTIVHSKFMTEMLLLKRNYCFILIYSFRFR